MQKGCKARTIQSTKTSLFPLFFILQFHRCGGGPGWLKTDKQSKLSNLVIKLTIQRSYIAPSHELCVIDIFKSHFVKVNFKISFSKLLVCVII